jgi:putative membrane protein insertion efficiency factor
MKRFFIFWIRLYRKLISPLKPPCCRFTPTCSAYALEAFKNRGAIKGFFLSLWRVLRCHPFSRGGFDPVSYGYRFKKIDLIRKKMGENEGESSAVTVETKEKRKVMLLPLREDA